MSCPTFCIVLPPESLDSDETEQVIGGCVLILSYIKQHKPSVYCALGSESKSAAERPREPRLQASGRLEGLKSRAKAVVAAKIR